MLLSQRGSSGHLAYGAWNEAEDVLAACCGEEIQILDRHTRSNSVRARRIVGRGVRRIAGNNAMLPATARQPTPAGDHVFFIAHGLWDLPLLERLRGLRRAETSVAVWISEAWPNDLQDPRVRHECYSLADHIFVTVEEAAERLAEIVPSAKVHVLPPAVDVQRFAPPDPAAPRGIAVLGIGRRDQRQHAEILDWSRSRNAIYLYDTLKGQAVDWREHREALADLYRHSNVAICNYAKHDLPELTGGLRVLPGRLYEALAAGSVLVGLAPDEDRQRKLLGMPVVEDLHRSELRLTDLLEWLQDSAITEPARARNMALAYRGHDWSHRWKQAFEAVGQPVPPGLQERVDHLGRLADAVDAA